MHLLRRQHHQASPGQQRRAREREGKIAHRPELRAVQDRAICLPDADRKPLRRTRHESAGDDPVHRYLAALPILLDHEHLAYALDDALDHVSIGELHDISCLHHRDRRPTLKRKPGHPIKRHIDGAKAQVLPDDSHPAIRIRERTSEQARNPLAIGHDHLGLPGDGPERGPSLATGPQCASIWPEDRDSALKRRTSTGRNKRPIGLERRVNPRPISPEHRTRCGWRRCCLLLRSARLAACGHGSRAQRHTHHDANASAGDAAVANARHVHVLDSALEDREVALGHLRDDERHCGRVRIA